MYQSLQAGRAVAASLVVLFHLGGMFAQDKYFGLKALDIPFAWGDAGVEFFFVLSGFLITITHRADFGHPEAFRGYVAKRLLRIYPTYWVICLAVCAAAVVAPALRQALSTDPIVLLKAFALVPQDPAVVGGTGAPILFVAWSLQYEMLFYGVVGLLVLNRWVGALAALGLLAVHASCQFGSECGFPRSFVANNLVFVFAMGVAGAYLLKSRFQLPRPLGTGLFAIAAFVGFGVFEILQGRESLPVDRRLVYGSIGAVIILALAQAEDRGTLRLRHPWIKILGDSSYALYLLHIPVISILAKLGVRLGISGRVPTFAAFIFAFLACVAVAVAFHLKIERRLLAPVAAEASLAAHAVCGFRRGAAASYGAARRIRRRLDRGASMSAFRALLRRPTARRIFASTGSNAYSQLTTIAVQLLSLPLFLSRWDLATYGQWMILSAVPSYLSMADVGMVTAAGNRMTMLIGEGNRELANRVFQSVLVFMLGIGAIAILLVLLAAAAWPVPATVSWQDKGTVVALAAGIVVTLVGGLPEAVYRATQRYALGNALSNTTRLLEWLGGLAGLWLGGSFLSVACGALVPRVLCTLAMVLHAARSTPIFRWGFSDASVSEVRACAGPAVSFMAFPAANALNFQGMTLIAAAVLGPAATVVFNTYRTMARVTVQATATFSNALWPEFARIYGRRDLPSLRALYRRSSWLGIALAAAASAIVYFAAPGALHAWSKGHIAFLPSLMFTAMVYAGAAGGWHVSRVLLLSTNEHRALAWPFLIASAAALPLAWVAGKAEGLVGIMVVMLALEVVMLLYCSWLSRRLLHPRQATSTLSAAV